MPVSPFFAKLTAALLVVGASFVVGVPSASATNWGLPAVNLSQPLQDALDPQVAIAPDGTTTVVWRRSNGSNSIIQAATRPAGSNTFGAPVDLSQAGRDALTPQLAVALNGATTVAWSRYDGSNNSIIQAATRPAGSNTFGAPVDLSVAGRDAVVPQLAIARDVPDGATTVTWSRNDGSNSIIQAATRPAGSNTFGAPEDLSVAGQNALGPQLAVTPNGATTVVWERSDGSNSIIQAATRPAGSNTFGAPEDLSVAGRNAERAQLAVALNGATTVVWRRFDGSNWIIQAATRPAGPNTFGVPENLSVAGQNASDPQLAIARDVPDGATTVTWQRFDGSSEIIQAATRPAGSNTFGAPENLSQPGLVGSLEARVAVAPDGATTVVWQRFSGSFNFVIQATTRAAGSSTFSTPQDLSQDGQFAFNPQLAIAPDGAITVTWRRSNGANNIVQAVTSTYQLSVVKSGTGSGAVTSTPAGINCGATCQSSFNAGQTVTLAANAAPDSTFTGWSGSGCSGTGTCSVAMSEARSVTATFTAGTPPPPSTYVLSVNKAIADTGTGTVASSPAGIDCGNTCQKAYDPGTRVTLTATADPGSRFTGWTGDCTNQTGPCEVTMNGVRTVTARFAAVDTYSLTVAKQGTGQGSVTSTPAGIDCGSTCESSFNDGEEVTLTASAAEGSAFTGWTGACSGTAPCQVTMDQARQVTAIFQEVRPSHMLTVTRTGDGQGTITSNPSGINCGSTCQASFEEGTQVTLTASAAQGSEFTGWTGACSGTGPCQVTVDEAEEVTANFAQSAPPRLSVTKYAPGPRRLNESRILRMAWVECKAGTCQIDNATVSFKARGKASPGTATYSREPFQAGERRLISTKVPNGVNQRLTRKKSGVAILQLKASARSGELVEDVSRTVRQGLIRCPVSQCG